MKTDVDSNGRAYKFLHRLYAVQWRVVGEDLSFDDVVEVWRDPAWQCVMNIRQRFALLMREHRTARRQL